MTGILENFDFNWKIINTDKTLLYHYTDVQALQNILGTRCLWASNSSFLNDASEIQYVKQVFDKVYARIKATCDEHEVGFFDMVVEDIDIYLEQYLQGDSKSNVFIVSLSENPDSLVLWSNYSRGDGYNIGFHSQKLIPFLIYLRNEHKIFDSFYHGKVIYDEVQQEDLLYEELRRIYKHLWNHMDFEVDTVIKAQTLCQAAVETYPIQNVMIGPKNNIDIAEHGLRHCLRRKGYGYMANQIKKSQIPLRY